MDSVTEDLIEKTIAYWVGKKNNPLNEKTFKEIGQLAKIFGPELKGYIA